MSRFWICLSWFESMRGSHLENNKLRKTKKTQKKLVCHFGATFSGGLGIPGDNESRLVFPLIPLVPQKKFAPICAALWRRGLPRGHGPVPAWGPEPAGERSDAWRRRALGGRGDVAAVCRHEPTTTPTPASEWNRHGKRRRRANDGSKWSDLRRRNNGPGGPHKPPPRSGEEVTLDSTL